MIPSVISNQLKQGIDDFLRTTFPIATPFFHNLMEDFLKKEGSVFKGPYVSIKLPFRTTTDKKDFFPDVPCEYDPYVHQLNAFERLSGNTPLSTIIATGTGSGKTECFLYPILDYCYTHRAESGIKAIIIYPMNALATNQAGRIAKMIHNNAKLRGHVTAGLFVGQNEQDPHVSMSAESIITNKDIIRDNPPDILLTNYKMLDYLLLRIKDKKLWSKNTEKSLRYLVVDELHTFDGAQGTDLSCLIRRLKDKLRVPSKYLCCVGTSATIGSENEIDKLLDYVKNVFSEPFDRKAIVVENRLSVQEFLDLNKITYSLVPEKSDKLKSDKYDDTLSYVQQQYAIWFEEALQYTIDSNEGKIELGKKLLQHKFFHNLLFILQGQVRSLPDIITQCKRVALLPETADYLYCVDCINSICALISYARGDLNDMPFLHVRYQLWMRELRRMVSEVSLKPELTFSDDLKGEEESKYLPMVHCRECGCAGWGGVKKDEDSVVSHDLKEFYFTFFKKQPWLLFLFPTDEDTVQLRLSGEISFVCGKCLSITNNSEQKCPSCQNKELVRVFIPHNWTEKDGKIKTNNNCPFCGSHGGLTIMGSRAASLTSVMIGQLFASRFNKDKKLITFSDSVQDAALHAGFFGARTYSLNFRAALQQLVDLQGTEMTLTELPEQFVQHWTNILGVEKFIASFIAHNMEWLPEYEQLKRRGSLPSGSELKSLVDSCVGWGIFSEYGYRARIGRTLEKSCVSCATLASHLRDEVVLRTAEKISEEVGVFRDMDKERFYPFILGLIIRLKVQGGIYHPGLEQYIQSNANSYLLNRIPYMPNFSEGVRAPVFLTNKRKGRFDTLLSAQNKSNTWYEGWFNKCFNDIALIDGYAEQVYKLVLQELETTSIFKSTQINQEQIIWGIDPKSLRITKDVVQMRCDHCGNAISVALDEMEYCTKMVCMRSGCYGHYVYEDIGDDYYGKLYSTANIYRIIAHEHTGLLTRDEREDVERRFINNVNAWDPNLLSATPTLEMGIDIGDLSSVFLCSVPPAQSNYIQRIGRAGRTDGNAFNLTVAEGVSHDLYFYSDPEEMISGEIIPPGVYLNASAILERQLIAFCFDNWVDSGVELGSFPASLGVVLNGVESKKDTVFPYTFLHFIQTNKDILLGRFFDLFSDVIDDSSRTLLKGFLEGSTDCEIVPFEHRVINSLEFRLREREAHKKRVDRLRQLIKKKESDPALKDQNYEKDLNELRRERSGIQGLIRSINDKDTLNYFTDEGFLPNYAFPEAGVILKSLIFRKKQKAELLETTEGAEESKGNYNHWVYEYERPAISAIQELAPANSFYAGGRKVEIDQVDLSLSEPQMWRFCDECSYSECVDINEQQSLCPRCNSSMWADAGQQKKMLRLRQVFATSSDKRSRIGDDAEERTPVFYNKQMLVDFDPNYIKDAYRVADDAFPFGFEFISKVTFREVNFGERGDEGEEIRIAGLEFRRNGFKVCKDCGKVQKKGVEQNRKHTLSCPSREKTDETLFVDCLYLYREFTSEAIRILLPVAQCLESPKKIHSFIAALQLGLKEKFGGAVDHLQVTLNDEPSSGFTQRKQYLMLYDRIPGGTGYLKQLMLFTKPLLDVFEAALEKLKKCGCGKDSEKDGCYQCIYAYRNSYDMPLTSRATAIEMLNNVLKYKDALSKIKSLRDVDINAFSDSVLETMFIEAIKNYKAANCIIHMSQEVVNRKPGYFLKVDNEAYYIEPQVSLDRSQGVNIPSKADFVLWPARSDRGIKPIVVFADGFAYHKDRIGLDTAQRMAIVQSNRFYVWSITYKDVERSLNGKELNFFENILNSGTEKNISKYNQLLQAFKIEDMRDIATLSSFDWLIRYLSNPNEDIWASYAFVRCLLWLNLDTNNAIENQESMMAEAPMPVKDIYNDLEPSQLVGMHDNVRDGSAPIVSLFVSISQGSIQNKKASGVFALFKLLDSTFDASFERSWIGFLRLFNLMQFLPMAFFLSASGIKKNVYDRLNVARVEQKDDKQDRVESFDSWKEVKGLAASDSQVLLELLEDGKIDIPEVGYELQIASGEIVGEAELAWEGKKIAIITTKQSEYFDIFTEDGWNVFSVNEAIDRVDEIIFCFNK